MSAQAQQEIPTPSAMDSDWTTLVRQSEYQLADVSSESFPSGDVSSLPFINVQSSLQQLQRRTNQIAGSLLLQGDEAKVQEAASRLLARGGVSARQLASSLQVLSSQVADVPRWEQKVASLEDLRSQVQEASFSSFLQRMDDSSHARLHKHVPSQALTQEELAERLAYQRTLSFIPSRDKPRGQGLALSPPGTLALGGSQPLALVPGSPGMLSPGQAGSNSPGFVGSPGAVQPVSGSGKLGVYSVAVAEANRLVTAGSIVQAASSIHSAYSQIHGLPPPSPSPTAQPNTLSKIWHLLQKMVAHHSASSALTTRPAVSQQAMLEASLNLLQSQHWSYILRFLRQEGVTISPSWSNLDTVNQFLQARVKRSAPLETDPVHSVWEQVYLCLRSGMYHEAIAASRTARDLNFLSKLLEEWVDTRGQLSPSSCQLAESECRKLLRSALDSPQFGLGRGLRKSQLLVLAAMAARSEICALLFKFTDALFSKFDDFLWFHLATVAPHLDAAPGSGAASLADLHRYLGTFPESHYTRGGADPLLFAYVMLMSAQPVAAMASLSGVQVAFSSSQRVDFFHLALVLGFCFFDDKVKASEASLAELATMSRQLGKFLLKGGQPDLALPYFLAASHARLAGGEGTEGQRLAGALSDYLSCGSTAVRYLLEEKVPGERILSKYLPDELDQKNVLLTAAKLCEKKGLLDRSAVLFEKGGDSISALSVITVHLANLLSTLGDNQAPPSTSATSNALSQAKRIWARVSSSKEAVAVPKLMVDTLKMFDCAHKFYSAMDVAAFESAVNILNSSDHLPFKGRNPERFQKDLRLCHVDTARHIRKLFRAMAACLVRVPDGDGSVALLRNQILACSME